jgi:hypothetical protein
MKIAAAVLVSFLPITMHAAELKFAAAVEAEKYPSVAAPEQAPLFRWDFSSKRDYRFRYEQATDARTRFSESDTSQEVAASFDLVVRSNGDGSAKLVFENAAFKASVVLAGKPQEQSYRMPTTVAGTILESGAITTQQQSLLILFPLPPAALAVGETADLAFEFPFNAGGSALQVKGVTHLTHGGYVMVGKRLCARLESRVEVAKLDVPAEVTGSYEMTLDAIGVYFFDVRERRFVRGVSASRTTMTVDMPTPTLEGGTDAAKLPKRMKMTMASDDRITVTIAE